MSGAERTREIGSGAPARGAARRGTVQGDAVIPFYVNCEYLMLKSTVRSADSDFYDQSRPGSDLAPRSHLYRAWDFRVKKEPIRPKFKT